MLMREKTNSIACGTRARTMAHGSRGRRVRVGVMVRARARVMVRVRIGR